MTSNGEKNSVERNGTHILLPVPEHIVLPRGRSAQLGISIVLSTGIYPTSSVLRPMTLQWIIAAVD